MLQRRHLLAGLVLRFDPRRPPGARIVGLLLRGEDGRDDPIEPGADYRIATDDFLRRGGDGHALLRVGARDGFEASLQLGAILAVAIAAAGIVTPRLDGRLARDE